jgi:hypothetical protein
MMGIGLICLLGKLHKWDESAMWFDGSSLGMNKPRWARSRIRLTWFRAAVFVFAIAVYLTVTIPALKAVVNPAGADSEFTLDQNLGLLGAGNTIIAGLLVLVLVMQARRTAVDRAAKTRLNFFSRLGWARIREAHRSEGVGCGGEGKKQGGQVGVKAVGLFHTLISSILFLYRSRPRPRLPSCTLAPTRCNGSCRGVLRKG